MAEENKKWGTIFMGEREASVDQLNAMQESLRKEKLRKEQTEDYMERVRARAADRAREILGAAYAERQKALDEARAEALEIKRQALAEVAKMKAEGETARKMGRAELAKAQEELRKAEEIREGAREEGLAQGLEQAGEELHETRANMGQSAAMLLRALERERKDILKAWREDLVELTVCAIQAGTGYALQNDAQAIMRALVFRALDMLEARATVTLKVNPEEEAEVSALFAAARERYPELRQWIVTGDDSVERGGLVAESGSGGVDLKRANFRQMVDNILRHLVLPESENEVAQALEVRDIVEREVANITGMTPEMETAEQAIAAEAKVVEEPTAEPAEAAVAEETTEPVEEEAGEGEEEVPAQVEEEIESEETEEEPEQEAGEEEEFAEKSSLQELEDELFSDADEAGEPAENRRDPANAPAESEAEEQAEPPDPKTLAEGGFL